MRTKMKSLFAMAGIAALAMTGCVSDTEDDANTNGENGEENAESAGGSDEALVLGLVPSQDSAQLVEDGEELAGLLAEELDRVVEAYVSDDYAGVVTRTQPREAHIGL